MLKGAAEMKEGVGVGGRGAPWENKSIPGDGSWEAGSEDAPIVSRCPLYIVNEPFLFCSCLLQCLRVGAAVPE